MMSSSVYVLTVLAMNIRDPSSDLLRRYETRHVQFDGAVGMMSKIRARCKCAAEYLPFPWSTRSGTAESPGRRRFVPSVALADGKVLSRERQPATRGLDDGIRVAQRPPFPREARACSRVPGSTLSGTSGITMNGVHVAPFIRRAPRLRAEEHNPDGSKRQTMRSIMMAIMRRTHRAPASSPRPCCSRELLRSTLVPALHHCKPPCLLSV